MKKILFSLIATGFMSSMAFAQNYDAIKQDILLNKTKEAKEELDKQWTKSKFISKPEAYILKASLYAKMMADPQLAADEVTNRQIAVENLQKYKEMDPKGDLLTDPVYSGTETLLFNSYLNTGIKNITDSKWDSAFADFKISSDLSDQLIKDKKIIWTFDTISNYYGAVAAQNAGKVDEAKRLYAKVADEGLNGPDYMNAYKFLIYNAFQDGDDATFNKYKELGHKYYPNEEYFTLSDMDFLLGMEDETAKFKRIDEKLAKEPNNAKLQETYGLILFDKLNKEGSAESLSATEKAELEAKMTSAITKSAELDPENAARGYYYLGNHYVNKSVAIDKRIDSVSDKIKEFNQTAKADKTGNIQVPKELATARTELTAAYNTEIDKSLPFLEKSAELYSKDADLSGIEKQNYKRVVDQLIVIYGNKRIAAKAAADKTKFEAQEKKWNDVYASIK